MGRRDRATALLEITTGVGILLFWAAFFTIGLVLTLFLVFVMSRWLMIVSPIATERNVATMVVTEVVEVVRLEAVWQEVVKWLVCRSGNRLLIGIHIMIV